NTGVRKHALWTLALMGDADSYNTLLLAANNTHFKQDASEATHALGEDIHQISEHGTKELAIRASQDPVGNTLESEQQHFRLAALKALTKAQPAESSKILIKELNRFDPEYQKEVLKIAGTTVSDEKIYRQWLKVY